MTNEILSFLCESVKNTYTMAVIVEKLTTLVVERQQETIKLHENRIGVLEDELVKHVLKKGENAH